MNKYNKFFKKQNRKKFLFLAKLNHTILYSKIERSTSLSGLIIIRKIDRFNRDLLLLYGIVFYLHKMFKIAMLP